MICPKCQTENPEEGKFCVSCGSTLQPPTSELPPKHPTKNKKRRIFGVILSLILIGGAGVLLSFLRKSTETVESVPTLPTPSETSPVTEGEDYCQTVYQQLLAKHAGDYESCFQEAEEITTDCEKPDGLGDPFKEDLNIELILDSSGSMAESVFGGTKMSIAKEVLIKFLDSIPERANVALRVYGHKGSNSTSDKAVSCAGTEIPYPFQEVDKQLFTNAINSFSPTGWTAIGLSLQKAKEDFARFDPEKSSNLVFLVSDGIETCDGNPVAAARELHTSDIKAVVNIVGFDVDSQAQAQLKQAAEAGGGSYFGASSADEMRTVFANFDKQLGEYREYRDCTLQVGRANRDKILSAGRRVRDCLLGEGRRERDGILSEARSLRGERIDDSCWTRIYLLVWSKWTAIYSESWSDWTETWSGTWNEWTDTWNQAWNEWNKKYSELQDEM